MPISSLIDPFVENFATVEGFKSNENNRRNVSNTEMKAAVKELNSSERKELQALLDESESEPKPKPTKKPEPTEEPESIEEPDEEPVEESDEEPVEEPVEEVLPQCVQFCVVEGFTAGACRAADEVSGEFCVEGETLYSFDQCAEGSFERCCCS